MLISLNIFEEIGLNIWICPSITMANRFPDKGEGEAPMEEDLSR